MARGIGRVALITGASRGLGAELAAFLAGLDFALVLTARGGDALAATAARLGRRPVVAIPGDVADAGHRQKLVAAAAELGGLDLLVNNASELGPSPLPALVDMSPDALERILAVNLLAPLALVRAAVPMLAARGGLIVNISSDAAVGGYPGWGGYGASKAALDLVTATLAGELRSRSIGAVAVDPGDMRTAMHQAAYPGEDISDRPLPQVTLPFFAWLVGQPPASVSGRRFRAQDETWEVAA
jgi:NAD(P)-dependent dehydrogenase (short-subunit alcohol dehydrogenase family)